MFAIDSALAYLLFFWECTTSPYVQVRHITWLSLTRPSPALVLQATKNGARRPGYEASTHVGLSLHRKWSSYRITGLGLSRHLRDALRVNHWGENYIGHHWHNEGRSSSYPLSTGAYVVELLSISEQSSHWTEKWIT